MRLPIVAYYMLFVSLFIFSAENGHRNTHNFYFQTSGSGSILFPKLGSFSTGSQTGGVLEQGFMYMHGSGFSAGILAGFGTYAQSITKENAVYRGFDFYRLGLSAGYAGQFNNIEWITMVEVNGIVARYEASVQEFFYPDLRLVGGIGLGGLHKAYITLPVAVQFRNDLDYAVSFGLGFRLLLNISPALFAGDSD